MDTTLISGIIGAGAAIVGALTTAFVGPIIYPWYSERMRKAQLRVERRMQVRQMIENELSKGFHDLASTGGYISLIRIQPIAEAQEKAAQWYINNELRFGPWLGYTVQDAAVKAMCEQYRTVIRDARMMVAEKNLDPSDAGSRLEKARQQSDSKAEEIVAKMNELGW